MMPSSVLTSDAIRQVSTAQFLIKRRSNLAFFANLLSTLLLCGSIILKDTLMISTAPCKLKTIGFQDVFLFNRVSDDADISKFTNVLNRCVTPDVVNLMYSSLFMIVLTLLCTFVQLATSLNCNLRFIRKIQSRGVFDVISVILCSLCLGFICWAASLIARFQFKQISMEIRIPMFSSTNETMDFIQKAKQRVDSVSVAYSGGFYFVLLAGMFSIVALATRSFSVPFESLRRSNRRRVEPHPRAADETTAVSGL